MLIASLMNKCQAFQNKSKDFSGATHFHKFLKRVQSIKTTLLELFNRRIQKTNSANGRIKSIADMKVSTWEIFSLMSQLHKIFKG